MNNYEHRKARKNIIITDVDGKPASGRQVIVKLENHKFLFGCGAFDVLAYTDADTDEKKELFAPRAKRWEELSITAHFLFTGDSTSLPRVM